MVMASRRSILVKLLVSETQDIYWEKKGTLT